MTVTQSLELVREFVNTFEVDEQVDALGAPADLAAWLHARGLLSARASVSAADLRRAREVREALRALLLANNGVAADIAAAFEVLDRAALRAGVALRFATDGVRLEPTRRSGVDRALGVLLGHVADAMARGTWARLKACRADDCRWAFYDSAKNQSRTWCSMRVCGNRQKARIYRRRHARA